MLKSFSFQNFKSFDQSILEIEKLTSIIGTNAGGKTNGIEGIKILSEISSGRELAVILDGSKNVDSEIRGGSIGCPRIGTDTFTLGCLVDIDENYDLEYSITIKISNRVFILAEHLYKRSSNAKTIVIFQTKDTSDEFSDINVEYNNGRKGRNPELTCIRSVSILAQLSSKMPVTTENNKKNVTYINLVLERLGKILFLDPLPSRMRDYSRMSDHELRPTADNISSVLYQLCQNKEYKKGLLKALKELPENEILDISFIETSIGDVMFRLKERYGERSEFVEAKRLSDGTLRYLAILSSLISEEPGSMIVIEEVDNGIHPSRIKTLIQTISRLTQEKQIDVIITTHNPTLLNALTREELLGVVLCYRDPNDGSSKFYALPDIESLPTLLSKGNLGDLTVKDELVKALKKPDNSSNDLGWLGV
ncbi:AAA family ATPase [Cohnella hashimotonis]|uniref:ATP-binding protein n=1 Tax=Cohnella hashimotonis TaxID=2826895 RepID=A0ABT6TMK2_9BACL|nr:ATP-binding protein [Cohnella hashimotonis]MDI4648041.1 ATP-binding protein [Cohnella hashimotonis]